MGGVGMFWDVYCIECDKIGKKPNKVASELGLSSATTTRWKSGAIPNGETLVRIAEYFHVSVDYLLGRSDEPNNNSIQTGDISNTIHGDHNNNNVNIGNAKNVARETLQEIGTILSKLTPRQRTELMMIIYQFADEHTV